MESAARMAQRFIYGLGVMTWLGAAGFAAFRIHQIRTLPAVSAEVLDARTSSYFAARVESARPGKRTARLRARLSRINTLPSNKREGAVSFDFHHGLPALAGEVTVGTGRGATPLRAGLGHTDPPPAALRNSGDG
jgi:hypothetical protein